MPNKIYTKFHSYDKKTDSLIVSFASDETASQNPADYNPVVVQPSLQFPEISDQKELEEKIAMLGIEIAKHQKLLEDCNSGKGNSRLCETLVKKGVAEHNLDS
jgi:hypothetical protein